MHNLVSKYVLPLNLALALVTPSARAAQVLKAPDCVIAGPVDAPLTIQEFVDFECHFCSEGSLVMEEVLRNYPGKVRLVLRNMPLPSHPHSLIAAKAFAAVCLQSPALAYSFQKEVLAHEDQLINEGEAFLDATATRLSVDLSRMKSDMYGEAVTKSLSDDQHLTESLGFKGTPSFLIGSFSVVGLRSYEEFKQEIDQQLGH